MLHKCFSTEIDSAISVSVYYHILKFITTLIRKFLHKFIKTIIWNGRLG